MWRGIQTGSPQVLQSTHVLPSSDTHKTLTMAKKKKNSGVVDADNDADAASSPPPAAKNPLEEDYTVTLHGSGTLVSHPPVFSHDSSLVYVVQSSSLLVYSTTTGLQVGRYTTAPSFAPIANVHYCVSSSLLIVVTVEGGVVHLHPTSFETVRPMQKICFERRSGGGGQQQHENNDVVISQVVSSSFSSSSDESKQLLFILCDVVGSSLPWLFSVLVSRGNVLLLLPRVLCRDIITGHRTVAATGEGGKLFVVGLQETCLFVKEIGSSSCHWHKLGGDRQFTAVDARVDGGEKLVVATGDDSGRVVVWHNADKQVPVRTVLHWHTLSLPSVVFAPEGTHVLSAGGECVLVLWSLVSVGSRRTLPRLGMPILHVTCSPDSATYAVAHKDNTISLISAAISCPTIRIQNILQGQHQQQQSSFLKVDPVSSALVLAGRPGHLQFYDPGRNRHLRELDVVGVNYVTGERGGSIPNAEVVLADFQGEWLATIEERRGSGDNNSLSELRLKFWRWMVEKQTWSLSTSVEWPHDETTVTDLKLQPHNKNTADVICISSSSSCFKTWSLVDKPGGNNNSWWGLESVTEYRGLACSALAFSNDNNNMCGSSLVAAGFGPYVTLWDTVDLTRLRGAGGLKHSKVDEDVTKLSFGGGHMSSVHLLVVATGSTLAVWDVITCSMLWAVPSFKTIVLVTHPELNLAAAFSSCQDLIVFELTSREPVGVFRGVSSSRVTAGTFVRSKGGVAAKKGPLRGSTIMFVNEKQELGGLIPKNKNNNNNSDDSDVIRVAAGASSASSSLLTPFASLLAETTVREEESSSSAATTQLFRSSRVGVVLREVMDGSPSVMAPASYYAQQVVQALSRRKVEGEDLRQVEGALKLQFDNSGRRRIRAKQQQQGEDQGDQGEEPVAVEESVGVEMMMMSGVDEVACEDVSWIIKALE